jgi:hypothetical protein
MERFYELSGVTAVTICSMGIALLIEIALLKLIFHCLAHVRVEAVEDSGTAAVGRQWMSSAVHVGEISRQLSAVSDTRVRSCVRTGLM